MFDKFANGFLGYVLVTYYSENDTALRYIIGLIPTLCALCCAIITYFGLLVYSDRMAKISSGSIMEQIGVKSNMSTPMQAHTHKRRAKLNKFVDVDLDG